MLDESGNQPMSFQLFLQKVIPADVHLMRVCYQFKRLKWPTWDLFLRPTSRHFINDVRRCYKDVIFRRFPGVFPLQKHGNINSMMPKACTTRGMMELAAAINEQNEHGRLKSLEPFQDVHSGKLT